MQNHNCIVVLGPTASGKTRLACQLAFHLNGEIISADSRQVYRFLDIGTGKDLNAYTVCNQAINYHLIDIVHPREQFYLHQFIEELQNTFVEIRNRGKLPIICGGTGLYLDAIRKNFSLTQIKEDPGLRKELEDLSKEDLLKKLERYSGEATKQVDINSKKRIIRGIEIAEYYLRYNVIDAEAKLPYKPYYIGIATDIENRKKMISDRLANRIDNGLIDEVKGLLEMGITEERLSRFGLEYKLVLHYLQNQFSKEKLFSNLQTAIFQFAKRQMTWFRRMEKEGVKIHWIEASHNFDNFAKTFKI